MNHEFSKFGHDHLSTTKLTICALTNFLSVSLAQKSISFARGGGGNRIPGQQYQPCMFTYSSVCVCAYLPARLIAWMHVCVCLCLCFICLWWMDGTQLFFNFGKKKGISKQIENQLNDIWNRRPWISAHRRKKHGRDYHWYFIISMTFTARKYTAANGQMVSLSFMR